MSHIITNTPKYLFAINDYRDINKKLLNRDVPQSEEDTLRVENGIKGIENATENIVRQYVHKLITQCANDINTTNINKKMFIYNEVKIIYDMRIFINYDEVLEMFKKNKKSEIRALRTRYQRKYWEVE